MLELSCAQVLSVLPNDPAWTENVSAVQTLDHHLRQRETALTSAEHRVELLRTRLENDASTTQKAAQAVEAERADIKVINWFCCPPAWSWPCQNTHGMHGILSCACLHQLPKRLIYNCYCCLATQNPG